MRVGDLVFVKCPEHSHLNGWAIVLQNPKHSDYCVLQATHWDKPAHIPKRWVTDSEEMENHYVQWSNGRWDFSQRFETKEAKKEFIKKHNAEIEEERRKKRENSSYTREAIHPLKEIMASSAWIASFLAIAGIMIAFYTGSFQLSLLCLAGLMLLS